jgi:hypothetical protein
MSSPVFLIFLLLTVSISLTEALRKRFIFRQDDFEDWFHSEIQVDLLNFFMDRGVGVSAGIIGDYVNGEDPAIYAALLRCASMNPEKCALFNHGSNAKFVFGNSTSVQEAKEQIENCDKKIKMLFPGYDIQMFTPHQNSWNSYAFEAVKQLNYPVISASDLFYSDMAWNLTSYPLKMPQQTTTAEYALNKTWIGIPPAKTIADCLAAASRNEDCIIMTHPHEFAAGSYTFAMLEEVVNGLFANGFVSINFATVVKEALGGKVPSPAPVVSPVPTKKTFLFRLDDIQDYYESSSQEQLINFLIDQEVGVTAGIIASSFNGKDLSLYNTLKRCVTAGPSYCSLANRGWDSSFLFEKAASLEEAKALILKADQKIKSFFPFYDLLTFIPYMNSWNSFTLEALKQLGYDAISASDLSYSGMKWNDSSTSSLSLLQFPQQTSLSLATSSGGNTSFEKVPINQVVAGCTLASVRDQDCVILVKPHDFATGIYSFSELKQLIDQLKELGFTSTNFPLMVNQIKGVSFFPTFQPTTFDESSFSSASSSSLSSKDPLVILSNPLMIAGMTVFGVVFVLLLLKWFGFGVRYGIATTSKRPSSSGSSSSSSASSFSSPFKMLQKGDKYSTSCDELLDDDDDDSLTDIESTAGGTIASTGKTIAEQATAEEREEGEKYIPISFRKSFKIEEPQQPETLLASQTNEEEIISTIEV